MRLTIVFAFISIFTALVAAAVIALWRHKKAGARDVKLVGEFATVETRLAPEGTVIVSGEVWRARSHDGSVISSHARVRVVGFRDFLALVKVCD